MAQASVKKRKRGKLSVVFDRVRKSALDLKPASQRRRLKLIKKATIELCVKMKVPLWMLVKEFSEASSVSLSVEETFSKLPRRCQRNLASSVGAKIASEQQIFHMRMRNAKKAGTEILVALEGKDGKVTLAKEEPKGKNLKFATIVADPIRLILHFCSLMAIQSDEFVDQSRFRYIVFLADYDKNHLSFGVRFVADRSFAHHFFQH